ncbi:MAG: hypothetical protein QOG77_3620 [Solirubrobacteraceae bacterium]|nr:hypothetical protein [Solirubrobacteraceae bacterium]
MAVNEIDIAAPPETVFDVLADPRSYAHWVVGSRAIHAADPSWPAPGAVFDHSQGFGPIVLSRDSTSVLESTRPAYLKMRVQARPISVAHVTLRLTPQDDGTHVVMEEVPADLWTHITMNPLAQPLLHLRNAESLRRLKRLAEGADQFPDGALPPRG